MDDLEDGPHWHTEYIFTEASHSRDTAIQHPALLSPAITDAAILAEPDGDHKLGQTGANDNLHHGNAVNMTSPLKMSESLSKSSINLTLSSDSADSGLMQVFVDLFFD